MPRLISIFGRRRTRGSVRVSASSLPDTKELEAHEKVLINLEEDRCISFASHISKYTGQTVTVFVNAGGPSGSGFTGVLLSANEVYIKLISIIGPPPSCPLGNSCKVDLGNTDMPCTFSGNQYVTTVGSVTYIPVDKIISFVHNTI